MSHTKLVIQDRPQTNFVIIWTVVVFYHLKYSVGIIGPATEKSNNLAMNQYTEKELTYKDFLL